MTTDLEALARRAVACKGWRWLPGMVDLGGWRSFHHLHDQRGALPDLSDPATLGCLIALVRGAWGDPRIHAAPGLYAHDAPPEYRYQIAHWHVYSPGPYNALTEPRKCSVTGATEAEALVKALEAAP